MTESVETPTVQAGPFRGTMRFTQRCGIITPETHFQGGLRAADPEAESPRRVFFGDQTSKEGMENYAQFQLSGIAGEVEVSGYFKHQKNIYGDSYLDESALFVEELVALG